MEDPRLLQGFTLCVILALIGCGLLFATGRHREDIRGQIRLFLMAIALRFALSVAVYQFGLVNILGDEDASGWAGGAQLHAEWVQQGFTILNIPEAVAPAFTDARHRGYYYLLAVYFWITDCPGRLPAAALNCFFGALTVVLAYRIAIALFNARVAHRVGMWCLLFPSLVTWSALTQKEPVVLLLETAALYGCVRLQAGKLTIRHIILCAAMVVLLLPFRFYAAYVVAGAVCVALLVQSFRQVKVGFASLAFLAILAIFVARAGPEVMKQERIEEFNLDKVQTFRSAISTGKAEGGTRSGVQTADVRTSEGLVSGLAVGAAHVLLAPFPWQLGGASLRMLLTLPELLVWWWLFFMGVIPGLYYVIRHRLRDVLPMLVLTLSLGALYSMMFGNVGLVFRQRAQLLPWLFIFAAVGMEQQVRKRIEAKRRQAEAQVRTVPVRRIPRPAVDAAG